MNESPEQIDWSLTTYEGSRREQLRRALKLSIRERLEALEGMSEISQRLAEMRVELRGGDLGKVNDDDE